MMFQINSDEIKAKANAESVYEELKKLGQTHKHFGQIE